jgi:cell division protein FtsB
MKRINARIKSNALRAFWITLTAGIAIFTIYTSVHTIRDMQQTKRKSIEVDKEIAMYEARIAADSTATENLKSPEYLERYAREELHMQREGETVYIIE